MVKQAMLDTNFILTAVKQKIDFFAILELEGIQVLIPKQVINELEKISNSKKKLRFREDVKVALKILEKNKFKTIDIHENYVDKGILKFAKENKNIIIATLDREIKRNIKNSKLVIRGKKELEII